MKNLSSPKILSTSLVLCSSLLVACSDSTSVPDAADTSGVGQIIDEGVDAIDSNDVGGESVDTGTGAESEANVTTGTETGSEADGSDNTTEDTVDPEVTDGAGNTEDRPEVTDGAGNTEDRPEVTDGAGNTEDRAETNNAVFGLKPAVATGADTTGNLDDSPTATESLSLLDQPFIKDATRSAGPPSAPEGLTMLLAAENFVEMSWIPSTDDQSVEAYEVYRDGVLVYTSNRNLTGLENERYWITTSYMDCNYTKANCESNPIVDGASYSYQIAAVDNEGMRSELSEPVIFQLAQIQDSGSNGPDLTGYSPIFNEEFEGDVLDRTIWKTALPWGPDESVNLEQQYFVNLFGSDPLPVNPFVMTGSTLAITAQLTPPELLADANDQPYLSGVITTSDNFEMTYGYLEMSAKVASGQGFLSTFFLFNQDFEKNKPEIDIVEYNGGKLGESNQTYHYFDSNRSGSGDGERHSTPTMITEVSDLSTSFHTYGVLWEPELVVWYIDGVEVRRLIGPRVSDEPMNIIAQLVAGSVWIGEPNQADFPKVFEIDYIKAWQR